MKKSNIIIAVYAAFIFAVILFVFIITKSQYNLNKINQNRKEIVLNDFNVIVGQNRSKCIIEQGSENKIVVNYLKEDKIPADLFVLKNDTLFINKNMTHYNGRTRVYFKEINTIEALEESSVYIEDIMSDKIKLVLNDARINFCNRHISDDKKIDLDIHAINSQIRIDYTNVNKLNVYANKSRIDCFQGNTFEKVIAELEDKSHLYLNQTPNERPTIVSDRTSHYSSSEKYD